MRAAVKIECPQCEGTSVEPVPLLYRSLRLSDPGRALLSDSRILLFADGLSEKQKRELLKLLAPPAERHRPLPAHNIALMAFLLSWLATSSYFIGKMGYKMFSVMSVVLAVLLLIPFFLILRLVKHDFLRNSEDHRRNISSWEKGYFCKDCGNIFAPHKEKQRIKD